MATPTDKSYGYVGGSNDPHGTAGQRAHDPATSGASAGQRAGTATRQGYEASERLRTGLNRFFDNTIQPSAHRDASHGSHAQHRPGTHDPTENAYTKATSSDSTARGVDPGTAHGTTSTSGKQAHSRDFEHGQARNGAGGHTHLEDLRHTHSAMEKWQGQRKKAPGIGAAPGVSSAPGLEGSSGVGRAPGIGKVPGIGKAPGLGKAQGVNSAPGLEGSPGLAKAPGMGRAPGLGKTPGTSGAPGMSRAKGTRAALERMGRDR